MIKKYLLLGMICLSALPMYPVAQSRELKRLHAAIESGDAAEVAILVKKNGVLTHENRQEILDKAEQKIAYYEDNVSVWLAKKDTARFLGGILCGILGIGSFGFGIFEMSRKSSAARANGYYYNGDDEAPFVLGGSVLSAVGFSLGKQALECLGSTELIKKAEEVFRLIEKAPIKDVE